MPCFDDYITLDDTTTSRSGLYASLLPGVDQDMVDAIAHVDGDDAWPMIYTRACKNLVSDISKNLQSKFFLNHKLSANETSKYRSNYNSTTGLAGVKINYYLPKYGKLHVITVDVYSSGTYTSVPIYFYDTDENGELLHTETVDLVAGRNTIQVDIDFEVDILFVCYNASSYSLKSTDNRYFRQTYLNFTDVFCDFMFYDQKASISQVNGGGLDVHLDIYCSIEKFVCENLNLFSESLWYKIGIEIIIERRFGERLNRFTTMTVERATELQEFYSAQYQDNLMNAIKSQNIEEDTLCFQCKNPVTTQTLLP